MTKINFVSPIATHMGYAEMARLIWPALSQHDIKTIDIEMQKSNVDHGSAAKEMLALAGSHPVADFRIANMVPILWEQMWTQGRSGKKIGYTTFEANKIPKNWVGLCNKADLVWTTSDWNAEVIRTSGDIKTNVFSIPPIANASPDIEPRTVKSNVFTFFSSFQWSERKNPTGLIKAFCAAFDNVDDVHLIIKTHSPNGVAYLQKQLAAIIDSINLVKAPKISLLTNILDAEKINKIYSKVDAFFSMSHGEGWGLPAWEALLAGVPVLHTNWSAPTEFLVGNKLMIDCHLTPVDKVDRKISPFFEPGMWWAEPHIDDAVDKLRTTVSSYSSAATDVLTVRKEAIKKYTKENCISAINASLGV